MELAHAIREHGPLYLMEAAGLGIFMVSAGGFATLIWHPGSPLSSLLTAEPLRLLLMGLAMGLTAVGLIYSPWGKKSGAQLNPAVTLTLLWLGKMTPLDAGFYVAAQFIGGTLGVILVSGLFAGMLLTVYIALAAPISGMSINPARTVASAIVANQWTALWIYFVGPLGGMLLVGEIFRKTQSPRPACVGLNQSASDECIFECGDKY